MASTLTPNHHPIIQARACGLALDLGARATVAREVVGADVLEAAQTGRGVRGAINAALGRPMHSDVDDAALAAAFSTADFTDTLGTAGAIVLGDAIQAARPAALDVCRIVDPQRLGEGLPVPIPRIDGMLQNVRRKQEAPSLTPNSTSSTLNMFTYGGSLSIDRQHLLSPGADEYLRNLLLSFGNAVTKLLDQLLAVAMCEASDVFYTSARGNRLTSSALTAANLAAAEATIFAQADETKEAAPLGLRPAFLVVPPSLLSVAEAIVANAEPDASRRRLRVLVNPWLAHSSVAGSSSTAWYVAGDPRAQPALLLGLLGGALRPEITVAPESAELLGQRFVCTIDVGIGRGSYRSLTKATA